MTDHLALARAIATRTAYRFIEIRRERKITISKRATMTNRVIEIPRERGGGKVPFTGAELR